MNKTCLITAMILVALMSTASYGTAPPEGALSVLGNRIVNSEEQPVSFAGVSFFWSNDGWGGSKYYNADCLDWLVSDWNVEIVRAAMGVEDGGGYLSSPTNNKDRLKTIVDASIAAGIYVLIDWHSHHAEDYESEAIDFFEEMATTYGGYDNVIYEIYNEPLSGCSWSGDIKPYAEAVIAAIRAIDPDNLIVVGSPEWSQRVDLPAADPITGYINIAYTLHFYADMGHTGWLRTRASNAMNDGIALMVTEWGPKGYLVHDENTAWMAFCNDNYVSHTAWAVNDKDEPWSFLDRWIGMETGGWTEEDLSIRGQVVKDICLNWDDTPTPPPPPGIVGHWKLDENQGSTAADSTTEGNDGTLAGDTAWVTGETGSALVFDGTGDYVDLGNPSVLDFGTYDFTLCAWVKNPVGNNVVAKGGDESGGIRYCLQVGSTVGLLVDDNIDKTSVSGGSGLQDGYWHHVAGVRDGGTLRVFIDSVEVASGPLPYTPYNLAGTSQHNAYIGAVWQHQAGVLGDFYAGSVDDVRIYSGALTSTELAAVMLDGGGPPDTTPPDAPTGLAATPGDAMVSLDWDDNAEGDLAGYNVYRSTTSGSGYGLLNGSLLTSSDYIDNSVTNDTTYYYVVTAEDTSANESTASSEDSATPTASTDPGYQESGGTCVMEGENAVVAQRSDNITWVLATSESGYIGSGYMTPPDNTGNTVTWSTACEVSWLVNISTPGTYYIAVRRIALDNGDDSACVGVDGVEKDSNTFNGSESSWKWSRGPSLGSLSAGAHTVQIRRREDGFCIDRVMIADSLGKLPADGSTEDGPAESPFNAPSLVFSDSFENGEWNGLWSEDSQSDWYDSSQRAVDGSYSAEVDGSANDATLTSIVIDLQGETNATVTFSWLIENRVDSGEYLAFDVSTNGGSNWTQKAILQGNVDQENTWHNPSIDVTDIGGDFQIRFRGKMSAASEDADVDMVEVNAW